MELQDFFTGFWQNLTPQEQNMLESATVRRTYKPGEILHQGGNCDSLYAVIRGQLRVYMMSGEGRQVTLYRLFERDFCLFSASCIMADIQFDVTVEAEKETEVYALPAAVYQQLMQQKAEVAQFTMQIMASRFTEVMWRMDQILFKKLDTRLAAFLLEESQIEGSLSLHLTHEKIAAHLGTAREVVTRLLKYLQSEGIIKVSRGEILILDEKKLIELVE